MPIKKDNYYISIQLNSKQSHRLLLRTILSIDQGMSKHISAVGITLIRPVCLKHWDAPPRGAHTTLCAYNNLVPNEKGEHEIISLPMREAFQKLIEKH